MGANPSSCGTRLFGESLAPLITITWCVADVASPPSMAELAAETPSGRKAVFPTGK